MDLLDKFEKYLNSNLPTYNSFHPNFNEALSHILKSGGKRFRPMLILGIVEAVEPMLLKNALDVALGVEMFHTYSLIHDDLKSMDNADTRRGVATTHILYDEATAILAGDGLNTHAFYQISKAILPDNIKIEIISLLAYDGGIGGMVTGQAIDLFFENKSINIKEIKFLHIHKTAKLIATSLKIGAIISGCNKQIQDDIYNFGIEMGLLFQIQDDIIDATLSSKEAKKDTNKDMDKNSFVNILGIENSKKEAKIMLDSLHKKLSFFDKNIQYVLKKLIDKYIKSL